MNRPIHQRFTHPSDTAAVPQEAQQVWLSRSFWFIAVCGFVTGGFAALGERGDELAGRAAAAPPVQGAAQPGHAPPQRWKAPPPVSQQVATAGGPIPLAAPTAQPAPLGLKGAADNQAGPTTSKTAVVLLLLGVLGGAAILLGKKKQGFGTPKDKQLEVVESIRVAGRYQLCLVRAAGRLLVLGTSEKGLTLLTSLDDQDGYHHSPEAMVRSLTQPGADEPFHTGSAAPAQTPFRDFLAAAQQDTRPAAPRAPQSYPVDDGNPAALAETRDSATRRRPSHTSAAAEQPAPRRRYINAHSFQEQAREQAAAAPSRDVFLDHLVNRLSAATPNALRDVVASDEAPSHVGSPLARYQRSMAR